MSSRARGAAIVLMHTRGRSRDMYEQASYGDVVAKCSTSCARACRSRRLPASRRDASSSIRVSDSRRRRLTASRRSRVSTSSASSDARWSSDRRGNRFWRAPLGGTVPAIVARLGDGGGGDGGGARRRARRPRPRGERDAAGGARRRRDSAVSSRRLMNWLTALLRRPDIGWADALDIAIVSFLMYELLLLIRGTRAVQMALSGGFLLLLYFLSQWLQLETVNWVIRNLAAYVVFAIIVLFQADIRRALAHFGRAPFFRYFERAEHADETIEELVVAADEPGRAPHRAPSSCSSGRSAFATTSRAAFRSTR